MEGHNIDQSFSKIWFLVVIEHKQKLKPRPYDFLVARDHRLSVFSTNQNTQLGKRSPVLPKNIHSLGLSKLW